MATCITRRSTPDAQLIRDWRRQLNPPFSPSSYATSCFDSFGNHGIAFAAHMLLG